ncbi:MAG: DUF1957 domain-containing protein [Treponema sp.]|nr:DUF1957 domain-containing protein [Treponema sp.]
MAESYAVSLVLDAHFPFVRDPVPRPALPEGNFAGAEGNAELIRRWQERYSGQNPADLCLSSAEEGLFFDAISETYLPLLGMMDRLENDCVPFRLGLALSPLLAEMLEDELLMRKYEAHLDQQIAFGIEEVGRLSAGNGDATLAADYLDQAVERRAAFSVRYGRDIMKALAHYGRKERLDILATSATGAFLPFLCRFPEALQAQIEVGLSSCRNGFEISPQGFWLPCLGWSGELEPFLKANGFDFTVIDGGGFLAGRPAPSRGSFFPVRTEGGLLVLARDGHAADDIRAFRREGPYRDNGRDAGHELPAELIAPFIARNGARCQTGYKYWGAGRIPYMPERAKLAAAEHARFFLENRRLRLAEAAARMNEQPISLYAGSADDFGLNWHEGTHFLESLFRLGRHYRELRFVSLPEYLCRQPISSIEVSSPEFSSWGPGGFAESWLDSPNDWLYRHLNRAAERMVELLLRFSGNSWVMERALNQAARELLVAQSSDWAFMLRGNEHAAFARQKVETALGNFTAIYRSMLAGRISAAQLTELEQNCGVFADINYRVFKWNH